MTSQTDLDQGGTFRTLQRIWLGPSIGYVEVPLAILTVTAAGITLVQLGINIITVNTALAVTLQLPKFKGLVGITNPLTNSITTLTINATNTAPNITILPGAGEFFDGSLTTLPLTTNFGSRILLPDAINGGAQVLQ